MGGLETLTAVLGGPPPASLTTLPDDVLTRLAERVDSARRAQNRVIDAAVRVAVDGVPLPVRGVVRKALLG